LFEAGRVQQIRMLAPIRSKKWKLIGPTLGKQHGNVTRQALFWNLQGGKKCERPKKPTGGCQPNKDYEHRVTVEQNGTHWIKTSGGELWCTICCIEAKGIRMQRG